jgi:hypothetical protein
VKPEPVLYIFHKIREQSEQADAGAWRALVEAYGPTLIRLLEIHAAMSRREAFPAVKQMLHDLSANGFERLRPTSRQSEREFLGDLRALLLDGALKPTALNASTGPAAEAFAPENVTKLLDGLPLVHKEMLFFKLGGYTESTIERIMRLSPRVAEKAFGRLTGEYQAARQNERERCSWPNAWLALLKQARGLKTENCTPAHEMVRIHDGQVSWYDKEPVEKHLSGCLHCFQAWTGLREVGYWRRSADPLSSSEIDELLEVIPVQKAPAKKKSFFGRLRP